MRNILKQGLKRFVRAEPDRQRGMRAATVIALAAQKGGVGKTTTSVNLAAALARFHEKKTLLLDLDPQSHVRTSLARQIPAGARGLSAVFGEDEDTEVLDVVSPTDVRNLHVCVSDDRLGDVESLLTTRIGKEFVLRDALGITRTHYDFIVIDCPPAVGNLTLNGLVAADQVLIPCDLSPLAVDGVHAVVRTIAKISDRLNPRIDVLGILLTRYDARNVTMNESVVARLHESYGDVVVPRHVGVNTDLAKAQLEGRNIFDFAPTSRGAHHHRELAEFVVAQTVS